MSKTQEELQQDREYRTISYLTSALANMCAGSPNRVIDLLTGYLWTPKEAQCIKNALSGGKE